MIKIIAFLIYSFFIRYSSCIDLILPLSDQDAPNFLVRKHFMSNELLADHHIHYFISYESLENQLITRVVYYGLELINDTEDHPEDFTRYVLYGVAEDRVIVGVVKKQSGVATCEEIFGVSRAVVSAFTQMPALAEGFIRNNDRTSLGVFLSSIFKRNPRSDKTDYGDLDSVDDEPKLLRGNRDISAEEIENEVDDIMEVAGTSHITEHSNLALKRKSDQISENESDSE